MVILTKQQYEDMLVHTGSSLPNEACGLLGGRIEGEDKKVEKIYVMENIDNSPEHFSMSVKEQFRVIADIRANGWQLIGNYHSHPASPSWPSEEDKRFALDASLSYLILSLQESRKPVLKSFQIRGSRVTEEAVFWR
jgi:proteasome lid subunit RPN8/RPN11